MKQNLMSELWSDIASHDEKQMKPISERKPSDLDMGWQQAYMEGHISIKDVLYFKRSYRMEQLLQEIKKALLEQNKIISQT